MNTPAHDTHAHQGINTVDKEAGGGALRVALSNPVCPHQTESLCCSGQNAHSGPSVPESDLGEE